MNGLSVRFALRAFASVLLLAAAAGCARLGAPEQTGPVTTKTDAGTMTALPASEVAARKGALVRFVHAVPGLSSVDLFAGDGKAFDNVAYKATSAYRELPAASAAYRLRLAGQDTAEPLVEKTESFGAGRHHTVVALPTGSSGLFSKGVGVNLNFLTDDFAQPAEGKVRVRVVNASPDLGEIDVYAVGRTEPFVKSAKFGSATSFAEAEPATAGLEVRRAGENISTLSVPGLKMEAGRLYTVFIVGGTTGASRLDIFVVEDQLAPPASK